MQLKSNNANNNNNKFYLHIQWMNDAISAMCPCMCQHKRKKKIVGINSIGKIKFSFHWNMFIFGYFRCWRHFAQLSTRCIIVTQCVCVCVQSNQSDFYFIAHNPMDQRTTIYLKRNINAYCFMLDFFRSVLFILYSIYIHHFVMHHCPSSWFTLPNKYYSISRVYTIYDITIYMDNGQRTIRQWVTIIGHHQFHNHKN